MNQFIDQCRREWKRLRVPRDLADEMAAELAADLGEATPEEVLGSDALDARSFAARWAVERGVSGRPQSKGLLLMLAILALVALAGVGGALAISASPSHLPTAGPVWVSMPGNEVRVTAAPVEVRFGPATRSDATRTIGSALLIAGLAGIALLAVASRRIRGV
jgi:hypothetical protein